MLRFGPRPLPSSVCDILDPPPLPVTTPSPHYYLPTPPYTPRPHAAMASPTTSLFTPHEMHALGSFFSSFDPSDLSSATRSLLGPGAPDELAAWSMTEDDLRAAVRDADAAAFRAAREEEAARALPHAVPLERTMNELLTWPPPNSKRGTAPAPANEPPAKRRRSNHNSALPSPPTTDTPSPPHASSSKDAGKKRAALLSPSQKKANHIQSEQKRRANIRRGYDALCAAVPALVLECAKEKGATRSEGLVLSKTIEHVEELLARQSALQSRLAAARAARPGVPPHAHAQAPWERRWDGGTGAMDDIDGDDDDDDE